jgi:uncharacterized membrane protein
VKFDASSRRAALTLAASVGLALVSAWSLRVVSAAYALAPPALHEAFGKGSFLGYNGAWFTLWALPIFALTLVLSALAVGGEARGEYGRTAWRRLLTVQLPLALSPFVLAQDDVVRRPGLFAALVGLALAMAAWWRPLKAEDPGDGGDAKPVTGWRAHAPMLAVMALHAAVFTYLAVQRDRALWSATVDLGIFKEALWNTLHGRVMYSPTVGYSFLGEHFAPVLFLLVPLYAVWPTSACLLTVQTLAITAAAWPVYRLARELGVAPSLALALGATMLFSPPMHVALLYDFHMDLLAVPGVTWLALALHRKRWGQAAAAVALIVSVKEDMFIPALAVLLASVIASEGRDRKRVLALSVLALGYGLVAILALVKRFGPPPGVPVYMADQSGPVDYKFMRNFRHLQGFGGPVRMLLGQPVRFVLYAFTEARLTTLLNFVAPLGFLSFAVGWRRITLLAPLGIVLLSDNPEIVSLMYHYSAIQHPGVWLAAVYGAWAITSRAPEPARLSRSLTVFLVTAMIPMLGMHPSSALARTWTRDAYAYTPHAQGVDRLVARIPPAAKVSVGTFLGPRVSNREASWYFPNGIDRADHALVDLQRPPWPLDVQTRDEIIRALMRQGWGAVAWEDGAVLLRRGGDTSRNALAVRDLFARRHYEVEGTEWTAFTNCAVRDTSASGGMARVVTPADPRPPGLIVYGPMMRLMEGEYRVTFRMRAESVGWSGPIGAVDVLAKDAGVMLSRELQPEMFPDPAWRDITLDLSIGAGGAAEVEFRVHTAKRWIVGVDAISIAAAGDENALVQSLLAR